MRIASRLASLLPLGLILLSACGAQVEVDKTCDCGFYTTNNGQTLLHWSDGAQVQFVFSEDFPETLQPAIVNAAATYNGLFEKTQIAIAKHQKAATFDAKIGPSSVSGDGINGVYFLPEPWPWAESNPDSDAMTVIKFSPEDILEADVFFRKKSYDGAVKQPKELTDEGPTLFKTQEVRDASPNYQWIYIIGVHELGHAMGRVHAKDEASIMYPTVGLDSIRHPFNAFDLDVFGKIYSLKEQELKTTEPGHRTLTVDGLANTYAIE